jgi:hypothetical protein
MVDVPERGLAARRSTCILFNMLVRNLGPPTAEIYGPGRMVIIYTIAGVCGFALSTLAGMMMRGYLFLSLAALR